MESSPDYSVPLSYQRIEAAMRHAMNQMEDLTKDYAKTADELGEAEVAFKVAFAKSRTTARAGGDFIGKVTIDSVDDWATLDTANERMAYESAKAKNDATRQALMTLRSRLEALRSLMASYRESGG